MEVVDVIQWIILPAMGGLAIQNFRNHGCIKKLEGKLDTHLNAKK